MRNVQIAIACTKEKRVGERGGRERDKLGTQVLILPIMERKFFYVNRKHNYMMNSRDRQTDRDRETETERDTQRELKVDSLMIKFWTFFFLFFFFFFFWFLLE